MSSASLTDFVRAHLSPPPGMAFYSSFESIQSNKDMIGYLSVLERAWGELKLSGVLCLENRPVLYLKEYNRPFSPSERVHLQRRFWNQGVANILILADPTSVYIYSGLAKPPKDDSDEDALVEILSQANYIQCIQSFYHDLATGHYYEDKQKYFDPIHSVDSWLLDNLRALRDKLIEGEYQLDIKGVHAFIGRVLFLCYLLDRGIYSVGEPKHRQTGTMVLAEKLEHLSLHEKRIRYLYDELFRDLKEQFNGNMFDQDLNAEKLLINSYHIDNLIQFLGGHNVKIGQRTLGFWAYDFRMIPVETISAIYQDFLAAEDPQRQQQRGAFYTPRFLAEMVVDIATCDNPDSHNWSFLDPSCGSGIFLVILFNRLANSWILKQTGRVHFVTKAKALKDILGRQIRGVDIEETACRIACFSLYLAYLDFFDPPDIRHYINKTGEALPNLLNYGNSTNRPFANIPVIHKADFLAEKTLFEETFDCIIGNPPWEGRQSKQQAQKFVQKVPLFLRNGGIGCLLLPSKILQNQTDTFQAEWLRKVTLEKVLQLADYRFLLFQNALCPAIIARFKNESPHPAQHKIEFTAPKFSRDGLRQGIIAINPSARTWIPLVNVLAASESKTAPVVWKRHLWGSHRDQKLLDFLWSLPKLSEVAGKPKEGKRWIKGQGFQPNTSGKSKNPKLPWWKKSDLYIGATASCWDSKCLILNTTDCEAISDRFPSLHRPRDPRIYKGPLVLVSQGFGKVAFCDFDVLFQDSLQSIAGPLKDKEYLMFLAGYLRSNLARYFLFHTAANWGSERDKVHLDELLRVPFLFPESVSHEAEQIVKIVAKKINEHRVKSSYIHSKLDKNTSELFNDYERSQLQRELNESINVLQSELEPLIYRYFGLTEQEIVLVEDTINVFEPSSTPTTWRTSKTLTLDPVECTTARPYATQGLKVYADTLTSTLNKWAQKEKSNYRVHAKGGTDDYTGLAIVTLSLSNEETAYQQESYAGRLTKILKEFHSHASRLQGPLRYERDIIIFRGKQVNIIRPNILMNWTRTAALNDAARIYSDIALSQKKNNNGN